LLEKSASVFGCGHCNREWKWLGHGMRMSLNIVKTALIWTPERKRKKKDDKEQHEKAKWKMN